MILVLILLVTTGALFVALSMPTGFRKRLLALCRKKASDQEVLIVALSDLVAQPAATMDSKYIYRLCYAISDASCCHGGGSLRP